MVTNYTGTGIEHPDSITAGSDGALWFADYSGSVGRITTSGAVTVYTGTGVESAEAITAGPYGGALGHRDPKPCDCAHHHFRRRNGLQRQRHIES